MQIVLESQGNLVTFIADQSGEKINATMIIAEDCLPLPAGETEIRNKTVYKREFDSVPEFLVHIAKTIKKFGDIRLSSVRTLYYPLPEEETKERHLKLVTDDDSDNMPEM